MDGENNGRTGEISKKNEGTADDKVDKARFYVKEEIARTNGESSPFRDEDENNADKPAPAHYSDENRANAEKDIHQDVKNARDGVS